jgi:hypothetical protein
LRGRGKKGCQKQKAIKFILSFLFLQPHHDRSSFSKYDILASHTSKNPRDDRPIESQLVLSISNWHFNRDKQHLKFGPKCKLEDVCISIKLSSTAFAPSTQVGASFSANQNDEMASEISADDLSILTSPSTDDSCFNFDKNGVIIPYFAFVSLMDDASFQQYLKKVVEKFEETEGSLSRIFLDAEEVTGPKSRGDDVDDEIVVKKRKKKVIEYLEDDEDDADDEVDAGQMARVPTPMANLDFPGQQEEIDTPTPLRTGKKGASKRLAGTGSVKK